MTTPTPRTDAAIIRDKMILSEVGPLEIVDAGTSRQLERDLAAAQDNRQYTCEAHRDEVKKGGRCVWCDLNVAHEELNTQAHELERLLNELSAAQERIREFEEASAGLTRNQVGLLNSLAHANERAQAAEARVEECEMIITAMTQWLEKQQPDVFRRGLWDAIAEGKKP